MTPDERLDQLEPLLSEATAILDRHTAQLKQHSVLLHQLTNNTGQLLTIASQHSDNIQFLLKEQAEMKAQMQDMQISTDAKLDVIINKLDSLGK